jgi:NAD(P)H-dependent FMN reductase
MNTTEPARAAARTTPKLYVIHVSTRPGRAGFPLSTWMFERAADHGAFDVELVDLRDENLPLFDEPRHPRLRQYEHEHTQRWSAKIDVADAFIFVTPEYDHATPPSLINALVYLVHEWAHKPVGFVSYGGPAGGTRAVQMVKPMLVALKMVVVLESVMAPLFMHHIDDKGVFKPSELQQAGAQAMLDALSKWVSALAPMRFDSRALAPAPRKVDND